LTWFTALVLIAGEGGMGVDQSLVGAASAVLAVLFAETARKVGDTLTSAATTAAADKVADQVAELVGRVGR
jgi:hypothetical protein